MIDAPYVLHRYRDYAEYVAAQVQANREKIGLVWTRERTIRAVAAYLTQRLGAIDFGLCHGTRGGQEQAWFRRYLNGAEVFGTEIAPTAEDFPHTIRWDFHEARPDWIGACDFVYSNSLDHAYDPEKAVNAWVSCLRPTGILIIEHSPAHGPQYASVSDPFGVDPGILARLIDEWGSGRYKVLDTRPADGATVKGSVLIVVEAIR